MYRWDIAQCPIEAGFFKTASYNSFMSLIGRLKHTPAFILGNAPSLLKYNLALLDPYFTIGINRTFLIYDPTIVFYQDIGIWNCHARELQELKAQVVARNISDPRKLFYNFKVRGTTYHFSGIPEDLRGCESTGPLAVQFAYALGCSPIVLIGMDCKCADNGDTDFWGVNKHWRDFTLDRCNRGLRWAKNLCPVEIIAEPNLEQLVDRLEPHDREYYVKHLGLLAD